MQPKQEAPAGEHWLELTPAGSVAVDLIRVEKNLNSIGFFASGASKKISRTVIQILRHPAGQRILAKAVIEGIPSLGLPTTADRDKYMAFMKLAMNQKDVQGELTNPVRFSGAAMIKLLGLRKGGFHYDEINDWCKRMVATTIMSESSIFLADRRQYTSDTFHVFDRVVLIGEELNDGTRSEYYQVYLSEWQLTNLNRGYILPLDFSAYVRLRRDIAKALFGHLTVWFYASRCQPVEKKYTDLCNMLNIRAYPYLSKAYSVLEPSMEELINIGYLSDWELVPASTSNDFKLVLTPGKRLMSLPHFAGMNSPEVISSAQLPAWVPLLIERGVSDRKAKQLALDIQESQPVQDQIEYATYLIQQDRRGRGKISNPAGFYIWAIEENLFVPPEFETSKRREQRLACNEKQQQESIGRYQQDIDYERYCYEQIEAQMRKLYPAEKLEPVITEQVRLLKREQPEWFARVPDVTKREVALNRVRATVRDGMEFMNREQWSKQNTQLKIF